METLRDLLDSKTLWVEYGIDDDISVCFLRDVFTRSCQVRLPLIHSQPFTINFPRANIYQMISPDLLHQVIKGAFKDHLVAWVCDFLMEMHGENRANVILDDIDRQCVPY